MSNSRGSTLGPPPVPGTRIASYVLKDPLGTGGSATVFRARADDGRAVAIKVLHPLKVLPEDVKRFTREFEAVSRMTHPNVVQVYEAGVHAGFPWIAMEFVDGADLDQVIQGWKESPPPDRFEAVERVLRGLCAGLQYVHELGFVHRDIKPTNIIVRSTGEPKLTDFGVVKNPNAKGTQLTQFGRLVGTVAFMAPEQIANEPIDARTDLYALGAVLYMMLTFKRPIEATSVPAFLARHLTEVPKPPHEHDPDIPRHLARLCLRLLMKDPAQRYASAKKVLQALQEPEADEPAPLRGRDELIGWFGRRLSSLRDGTGGVVALVGPPGHGRTHALQTLEGLAAARGLSVLGANAADGNLLRQLLQDDGLSATDPTDSLSRQVRMHFGSATWVLCVDDLDAADLDAIGTLSGLVRDRLNKTATVLLVFTTKPDQPQLATLLDGTTTGTEAEVIKLGALKRQDVIAMLRDRHVTGPVASVLGRRLHAAYRGRPKSVIEQLDALVEAGWLDLPSGLLRPTRPVEDFKSAPLTVPRATRTLVEQALGELDSEARAVLEIISVMRRATTPMFLARCLPEGDTDAAIGDLIRRDLLIRDDSGSQPRVVPSDPAVVSIVKEALTKDGYKHYHALIAKTLQAVRRRDSAGEAAHHFEKAGIIERAYPLYIRAARRAARNGDYGEVLNLCKRAKRLATDAEAQMSPERTAKARRWLHMLGGEAHLTRQEWDAAVAELERAVKAARTEGDQPALARCLSSLGRAHYRKAALAEAAPYLDESLRLAEARAPERASAARAYADIMLRSGNFERAEALWGQALRIAMEQESTDAEARARRGLAHLRALQGRLSDSADLLDDAEDLLEADGDARVRASVIARSIELDVAAGRFGVAMHRGEQLVELTVSHGLSHRLPEAWSLLALTFSRIGRREEAARAAQKALRFAMATSPRRSWSSALRACRILVRSADSREMLEALSDLGPRELDDPPAQVAVIKGRHLALRSPRAALDQVRWAVGRAPPYLCLAAAAISLDATLALTDIDEIEDARRAAKRGLKQLTGDGADGLRLELLLALHEASPDDRVIHAAGQLAERIRANLAQPVAATFAARADIRRALARASDGQDP